MMDEENTNDAYLGKSMEHAVGCDGLQRVT
jgi:hypothetical protein